VDAANYREALSQYGFAIVASYSLRGGAVDWQVLARDSEHRWWGRGHAISRLVKIESEKTNEGEGEREREKERDNGESARAKRKKTETEKE
jgi:hypothetical protein